jgi:amidase
MIRNKFIINAGVAAVAVGAILGAGDRWLSQTTRAQGQAFRFQLQEATIADVHRAIRERQLTCRSLVQGYVNRAKAYNGVSSWLVTKDGAPIPQAYGPVRAGAPLKYPTKTVAIASLLPDYDQYIGPPIELGRMEATASNPDVQGQYGMVVGIPHAGQVSALATLNLRGERSVTCRGDRDKAPSQGALPAGAPAVCEEFRKLPDALERAAELDAQYGNNPDLAKLPMYCIPFSFKDPFDTMDMRSTGGADARYDIDFPARDQNLVHQLREKGAIIYAKSVLTEYNGRAGNPGGPNKPTAVFVSTEGFQRSTWGGNPSESYDTTRAASLGSSSGSAVSVSTNLVMCGLCEETRASCRGPANHNSVALILPQKSMITFDGGAIGSDIYNDRAGIHCRSIVDSAKVLDALKDPVNGYYDPRDMWTTLSRASVTPPTTYTAAAAMSGAPGSLKGMRIGIIRESMETFPGVKADEPIVTAAMKEIKTVLGGTLGATLVESVDPLVPDDPDIPNMNPTYSQALAELVPVIFPEILYRLNAQGEPLFPEFAAKITPTEFAPGKVFGTGTLSPIDYMVRLADGVEPIPKNLNIKVVQQQAEAMAFRYHFVQYASRRAADWKARGFTETLVDFPTLNARSKFWGDDQRAAFKNWEAITDIRNPAGERQGIDERIRLRELLRRVDMKVILGNHLDVVVRLHTPLPPLKIGLAPEPAPGSGLQRGESAYGPNAGETEVLIPAGYVREVYDPVFVLSADKKRYIAKTNTTPTMLPAPGLPFSLVFRAEPGAEDRILKVAAAYQKASHRRVSPPEFPALPSEKQTAQR